MAWYFFLLRYVVKKQTTPPKYSLSVCDATHFEIYTVKKAE